MPSWPHAPNRQLSEAGAYIITTGTYLKRHYFRAPQHLQLLHDMLLDMAVVFGWKLEAWAVFSNHYHFVGIGDHDTLETFLGKLHTDTCKIVNSHDRTPGRQVWFNYWDSHLTFQRSYLARLHYVHTNAVHHRLVQIPSAYPWCSAAWFERTAPTSFQKTLASLKIERINVMDDYEVEMP